MALAAFSLASRSAFLASSSAASLAFFFSSASRASYLALRSASSSAFYNSASASFLALSAAA
jgi:hypothetical protein